MNILLYPLTAFRQWLSRLLVPKPRNREFIKSKHSWYGIFRQFSLFAAPLEALDSTILQSKRAESAVYRMAHKLTAWLLSTVNCPLTTVPQCPPANATGLPLSHNKKKHKPTTDASLGLECGPKS